MTISKSFWVVALVICLLAFTSVVMALSPATANAKAGGSPVNGDKPGPRTSIAPIKLGIPKAIGCSSTYAYSISAAEYPLVVGMAGGCGSPFNVPFIWSADTGIASTGNSPGAWARAVSDNGVIVGIGPGFQPATFDLLGNPTILLLPGFTWGDATGITKEGDFIVGYSQNLNEDYHAVVWDRGSDPDLSEPGLDIGVGFPRAVAWVGGEVVVVGAAAGHAVIWTGGPSNWSRHNLADGSSDSSDAYDINASGTVIAGVRTRELPSDPSILYDEHVVWVANSSGGWDVVTLKGADPNLNKGLANAVADQVDGSTLVVGFSWEDTPGPGDTMWPVVWLRAPGAGATEFQPPILLPQLSKKGGSSATDVNALGEVVGWSSQGNSRFAVMWNLQ